MRESLYVPQSLVELVALGIPRLCTDEKRHKIGEMTRIDNIITYPQNDDENALLLDINEPLGSKMREDQY
jgi:hypothetical protein